MSISDSLFCRFCAEVKPASKLWDLACDTSKYNETRAKLEYLKVDNINITVGVNSLPNTVCFVCYDELNRAYEFIKKIEKAQDVLKELPVNLIGIKVEVNGENDFPDDLTRPYDEDFKDEKLNVSEETEIPVLNGCMLDDIYSDYKFKKRRKIKSKVNKRQRINSKLKHRKRLQELLAENNCFKKESYASWSDYPWLCSYCDIQLGSLELLRTHAMIQHNTCVAFKCADCNSMLTCFEDFVQHVLLHRDYELSCYVCDSRLRTVYGVKKHVNAHLKQSYICKGCNMIFCNLDELNNHISRYIPDDLKLKLKFEKNISNTEYICNTCRKSFKSKGNLHVHLLIHTERPREHTCEKCGKRFYNKGTLTSHMLLHEDRRPFKCEICKSTFKTSAQLKSHVGIHGGPRPYSCEQCGRSFRLRCQLKSHLIIHTDSLPHVCKYCNKAFRFKTILTQHVRQHTGAKPYSCELCMHEFTNWPNYNKHMKRRHGMNMAKKKHTPEGVLPVNPLTGQVLTLPDASETEEWKKKILVNKKPGRPKNKHIDLMKLEKDVDLDEEKI